LNVTGILSAGQIAYTSSNADPTITVQNTGTGAAAAFNNAGPATTVTISAGTGNALGVTGNAT